MKQLISRLGIVPVAFVFGLLVGGGLIGSAMATQQPHMQNALSSLESAQWQLKNAVDDKGGHRSSALNYTNLAIQQVREGIQYANYYH
jgi:hypothetical protein